MAVRTALAASIATLYFYLSFFWLLLSLQITCQLTEFTHVQFLHQVLTKKLHYTVLLHGIVLVLNRWRRFQPWQTDDLLISQAFRTYPENGDTSI